jgi:hypothetical protein
VPSPDLESAVKRQFGFAVRHGGIDRQAKLGFDRFRVFNNHAQGAQQPDGDQADHQAKQNGNAQDGQRLGANRLAGDGCRVNDAYIAHCAGFADLELLGGIEQFGVELGGDLDIARQAQHGLLRFGKPGYLAIKLLAAVIEPRQFGIDGLDCGVLGGKALAQFFSFLLEFYGGVFDFND